MRTLNLKYHKTLNPEKQEIAGTQVALEYTEWKICCDFLDIPGLDALTKAENDLFYLIANLPGGKDHPRCEELEANRATYNRLMNELPNYQYLLKELQRAEEQVFVNLKEVSKHLTEEEQSKVFGAAKPT